MVRMACTVRRRRTCWFRASLTSRVDWRFGRKRRLVLLLAWLTLWPDITPLPEIVQRRDMAQSSREKRQRGGNRPERAAVLSHRSRCVKGGGAGITRALHQFFSPFQHIRCHSCESGNPGPLHVRLPWTPAFAGATGRDVIWAGSRSDRGTPPLRRRPPPSG